MDFGNKRKDTTPKKKEQLEQRKRKIPDWGTPKLVDLTVDDDANVVVCNKENNLNHMRCLFKEEPNEILSNSQSSSAKSINSDDDSVTFSHTLPPLSFCRNPKLPIYS